MTELVPTKSYNYGSYPFENFNPLQSLVFPHVEEDTNIVIAASTSSGKTIAGELFAGKTLKEGKRVIYLSPLKALVEEKLTDWIDENHPWSEYPRIIMSGDYQLTAEREKELKKAKIVISTYEMMAVRCRRFNHEVHTWIDETGCLIVDEAHFIGSEGRGDHLENALVLFTKRNPDARVIFLSATLTNCDEIARWLERISGKRTLVVRSDYRPCKLSYYFVPYEKFKGNYFHAYQEEEVYKLEALVETVNEFPEDQWLIFVHSKTTGEKVHRRLTQFFPDKIIAYHNADLQKNKRLLIEKNFRDRKINFLIATSTLAYGVNLPARRVCIVGLERGFNEVDPLDVIQECGRAGRPKYDKQGDAYIILREDKLSRWKRLLTEGIAVQSRIPGSARFHLIGEIAEERVTSQAEASNWVHRTLAYHQNLFDDLSVEKAFSDLKQHKLITELNGESDLLEGEVPSTVQITQLGRIASYYYFDPLQVAQWKYNLLALGNGGLRSQSDALLAWLVANDGFQDGYLPKNMRGLANEYTALLNPTGKFFSTDAVLARGVCLYYLLQDEIERVKIFMSLWYSLVFDIERILTCIEAVDTRVLGNRRKQDFFLLSRRIKYQLPTWGQAELCLLDGIGKEYSSQLMDEGITSLDSFKAKLKTAKAVLPKRVYEKAFKFLKGLK